MSLEGSLTTNKEQLLENVTTLLEQSTLMTETLQREMGTQMNIFPLLAQLNEKLRDRAELLEALLLKANTKLKENNLEPVENYQP